VLLISTPTSKEVLISLMCAKCIIIVEGRRFKINLICLALQKLDVILGMDSLSKNQFLIDCGQEKLEFSEVKELEMIFSQHVWKELKE